MNGETEISFGFISLVFVLGIAGGIYGIRRGWLMLNKTPYKASALENFMLIITEMLQGEVIAQERRVELYSPRLKRVVGMLSVIVGCIMLLITFLLGVMGISLLF